MTNFWWLVLNIGVPVLGPIFMLALVAPSYGGRVAGRMIFDSVKDGQLFWAAIALSASALYELFIAAHNADIAADKAKVDAAASVAAAAQAASHVSTGAPAASGAAAPSVLALQISIAIFILIALASALMVMLVGIKAYHDRREAAAVAAALAALAAAAPAAGAPAGAAGAPAANAPAGAAGAAPAPGWNANLLVSIALAVAASLLFAVMHIWIG